MNEERLLEAELLELIGHRFRRNLIHIVDLANLELTANSAELSDLVASLTRIKAESMQTLSIIDMVLSLAQQDKTPVPCEPFDLVALVQQLAPKLQRQATDAGTTLIIDAPVSPLGVLGSVEHLQKLLPLLLEFALWQGRPDRLRLQIVPDATAVRLSLQFEAHAANPNEPSGESMPLANLLSLWTYAREMSACGSWFQYAPADTNDWKLAIVLTQG